MVLTSAQALLMSVMVMMTFHGAFGGATGGLPEDPDQLWLCTPQFCTQGVCVPASQCMGIGQVQVWPDEIVKGKAPPPMIGTPDPSKPVCCVEMPNNCRKAHNGTCMRAEDCPFRAIPGGEGLCRDIDRTLSCCTQKGGPKSTPAPATPQPTTDAPTVQATPQPTPAPTPSPPSPAVPPPPAPTAPWPVVDRTCTGHEKCERLHGGLCLFAAMCPFETISGNGLCQGAGAESGIACCPIQGTTNTALTGQEALGYLSAQTAGVTTESKFGCEWRAPGCTSLDGVKDHVVTALAGLFPKDSNCPVVILGGTEFGHGDKGIESHQNGYVLTIKASACVDAVGVDGTSIAALVDPQRCQAEFSRDKQRWCKMHDGNWEVVFSEPNTPKVDKTREPNDVQTMTVDACINIVSSLINPKTNTRFFTDDYGYMQRHARACGDNTCPPAGMPADPNPRAPPLTGGVFGVTPEVFEFAMGFACDCGNEHIVDMANAMLKSSDFCALDYRAADSCVISALVARLYLLAKDTKPVKSIPDTPTAQETVFRNLFITQNNTRCAATFFQSGPTCRVTDTPREVCRMRIGIVVDESGSVGSANFFTAINAVKAFLDSKELANTSLVSLVQYSSTSRLTFDFTDPKTASTRMAIVTYQSGGTATHLGMERSLALFPGKAAMSPGDLYVLLVITDGQTNDPSLLTATTSTYTQRFGHVIPFAVGIAGYKLSELIQIAQGRTENVMVLSTFQAFVTQLSTMMSRVCRESVSVATDFGAPRNATNGTAASGPRDDVAINVSLSASQVQYINLQIDTTDIAALQLRVRSDTGCIEAFASTSIPNPSAAVHDLHLRCTDTEAQLVALLPPPKGTDPKDSAAWISGNPTASTTARRRHRAASTQSTGRSTAIVYLALVGTGGSSTGKLVVSDPAARTVTVTVPVTPAPSQPQTAMQQRPTTEAASVSATSPQTTAAATLSTAPPPIVVVVTPVPPRAQTPEPPTSAPTPTPQFAQGPPSGQVLDEVYFDSPAPQSEGVSCGTGCIVLIVSLSAACVLAAGVAIFVLRGRGSGETKSGKDASTVADPYAVEAKHSPRKQQPPTAVAKRVEDVHVNPVKNF